MLARKILHTIAAFMLLAASAGAQSPKAAYAMNEAAGTITADSSGNGNTGTLTNGPTWATGKYSGGVGFDGVNDIVQVPDSSSLGISGAGTIEAWVKLAAINRWNSVIAKGNVNNDNAHNYALEANNLNKWQCALGNGSIARVLQSSSTVSVNTFYHVACVWDGTNLKLYINGVQNATVAQNLTPAVNAAPLYFGQFGGNADQLSGVIDEVRIYNRALSTSELAADMNTSIGAPPPPPPPPGSGNIVTCTMTANPPTVNLSWTASPSFGVSNYRVYRGSTAGGPYALLATVGNVLSYSDAAVAASSSYYYVVTAIAGSESVYSNEAQAVIP